MTDFLSVHITAPSKTAGEKIAHALIDEKLAACVNIISDVRSIYRWEGKIEEADEVILIAKTRAESFDALEKTVKSLHPDACPCIVAMPVAAGHQPYLHWLARETKT